MSKINIDQEDEITLAIIKQMLSLTTAGFGVVAALAWNEVVKTGVEQFIRPYLPNTSGFISLLIYAVTVTVLAVVVTLNLTRLQHTFLDKNLQSKKK